MAKYPSQYTGQNFDTSVYRALNQFPGQISTLNTKVAALEEDVDDLSGLPAQVTQIGSKIDQMPSTSVAGNTDLDIVDESGNVLARFINGGIKTKNFDSSKMNSYAKKTDLEEYAKTDVLDEFAMSATTPDIDRSNKADFEITDDNGSSLVQFKNGHIKTKNFDSSKIDTNVQKEYPQFCLGALATSGGYSQNSLTRLRTGYIRASKGDAVKIADKSIIGGIIVHEFSVTYTGTGNWLGVSSTSYKAEDYVVKNDATRFIRIVGKKAGDSEIYTNKGFRGNIYVEHNTPIDVRDNKVFLSSLIPSGWYVSNTSEFIEDYPSSAPPYNDLIAKYDALVTDFPEYVTREELGTDQSGTYTVYSYTFTPTAVASEYYGAERGYNNNALPKIIIQAGIHPAEKPCLRGLANFLIHLCRNWSADDFLAYLRWNVQLIVIPCLVPWGYVNSTRYNVNHVDINRNFDADGLWDADSTNTDPTSDRYKGTAPYSEAESKMANRIMLKNADAIAAFDLHTFGVFTSYEDMTCWMIGANKHVSDVLSAAGFDVTKGITLSGWKNHSLPSSSGYIGKIQRAVEYGKYANEGASFGIPSASPEVMYRYYDGGTGAAYSLDLDCMNEEYIANMVLCTLRQYQLCNK